MSLLSTLEEKKDSTHLLKIHQGGFTLYFGDKLQMQSNCLGRVEGYDKLDEPSKAFIEANNVPTIDLSKVAARNSLTDTPEQAELKDQLQSLMVRFPMLGDDYGMDYPFNGMSYAPKEVLAAYYQSVGAELFNIKPVTLTPNLATHLSNEQVQLLRAYASGDERTVMNNLDIYHQNQKGDLSEGAPLSASILDPKQSRELQVIEKTLVDQKAHYDQEIQKSEELLKGMRAYTRNDEGELVENKDRSDLFTEKLVNQEAQRFIEKSLRMFSYQVALAESGDKPARKAVADFNSNQANLIKGIEHQIQSRNMKDEPGQYEHIHKGLRQTKKCYAQVQRSLEQNNNPTP